MGGKKDLATIKLSQDQAEKYSVAQIAEDLVPRLSNRRCMAFLVRQVADGDIKVPANLIGLWTYKAVEVTGVENGKVAGKKTPDKKITEAEYAKLSAKKVADLLKEHTTEKRAAYVVEALLKAGKIKPTAHDLVYLSNGRVAVAGIKIESTRTGIDMKSLVAGVVIGTKTEAA